VRLQTLNPVLDRELRQRSRSVRSVLILSLFLGLLIAVMYLAYKGSEATAQFSGDPITALTLRTGRTMFEWVLAAELIILLFIIPGISAGSVAGERDRQTLIPLQVTLIGPVQIFFGKVLASSSFLLLLLVGSAPVVAVPYLVGGISLTQVLLSLLSLAVVGFLMAVIGVGCSSFFRRTQTATLAAYAVVLALVFGTVILLVVSAVIDQSRGSDSVEPVLTPLYANPFLTVADAAGDIGSARAGGPFSPIKQIFIESQVGSQVVVEGDFAFDERTGEPVELPSGVNGLPLWARSLLAQTGIASVFAVIGIRRLRAPTRELSS
jgi:ABC-type transport system involved in multi-copper enzyme maturation permease subunit